MLLEEDWNPEISERAGRQSLIESFGIEGLYGYRSISLTSNFAATVLIAKNGTGKTTLLGALDAFLRLQLSRLRNLEFTELRLKLRPIAEMLIITQEDVLEFLRLPEDGDFIKLAGRTGVDPTDLFNFLLDEFTPEYLETDGYSENQVFSKIMRAYGYGGAESVRVCSKINEEILRRSPRISSIADKIKLALSDYDIVYLPTYRRVELALTDNSRQSDRRYRRKSRLNISRSGLFTGDIQFGLSDISDRLSDLNQQIIVESNRGYREISANIINELIDGSYERGTANEGEIPTESEMELFFSRLREGGRIGPYPTVAPPNLQKLYSGEEVPANSKVFLDYFLKKLKKVINSTEAIELPVNEFVRVCNKYLHSAEPSIALDDNRDDEFSADSDRKILKLNRANLQVIVECLPEKRRVSLDALSSGEKQMISLFAKLFLYRKKKIVLIDEPELSLSLDWQRSILIDVITSPLCEQLISITHSPFVFDNELEPFARVISSRRSLLEKSQRDDTGEVFGFDFDVEHGDDE